MTGEIRIVFDTDKQQMMVSCTTGMETQDQKNFSIHQILTAIRIVMDYKPNPIIRAASLPGNGNIPVKVSH